MGSPRVLISGAGIAGLSLGYWLARAGITPVVVDHAPCHLTQGHYISLKGMGVEVVRQMGLENACRAREFRYSQVKNLSARGKLLRLQGSPSSFDHALGGYMMLRRADLAEVLFEAVSDRIDLRYGTKLKEVSQAGDRVEVELSTGSKETFDFVIGADGIHSHTRRLAFGANFEVPFGGLYIASTQRYSHGLPPGDVRMYFGRGQSAMLLPTSTSEVSALFYYGQPGHGPALANTQAVKTFLLDAYQDFAPEVVQMVSALDTDSFVFADAISLVRMDSIVTGRVALVGDAAHCPTFMSGMGSSLALQGARLLALGIAEQRDASALVRYQASVSPIAARYQKTALQMKSLILDRRPWVSLVRDATLMAAPTWFMDRAARGFIRTESELNR